MYEPYPLGLSDWQKRPYPSKNMSAETYVLVQTEVLTIDIPFKFDITVIAHGGQQLTKTISYKVVPDPECVG